MPQAAIAQGRRITAATQPPDTAAVSATCAADVPGHLDAATPPAPGQYL